MLRIKVNSMAWPTAPLAFHVRQMLSNRSVCAFLPTKRQPIHHLSHLNQYWILDEFPVMCVKNESHLLFLITTLYHCSQVIFKCIHLLCFLLYLHLMTRLLIQYNSFDYNLCCRMAEHCRPSLRTQHDPLSPLSEHLHNTSMSLCTDAQQCEDALTDKAES